MLIGLQVSASVLLRICSAVFLRSTFTAASESPGIRITDTVVVQVASEPTRPAIVLALSDHPSVAALASVWPGMMGTPTVVNADVADLKTTLNCQLVSPEYFGVLGIEVLQGRAFLPDERSSNLPVVVV